MYQPEINEPDPRYPAFRMPAGQLIPGFGGKEILTLVIVIALSCALFASTGKIVDTEEVPLDDIEVQTAFDEMAHVRDYLYSEERTDSAGAIDLAAPATEGGAQYIYIDAVEADEVHAKAEELGITAETTDEELSGLVPKTATVEHSTIPLGIRIGFFLLGPICLYIGFTVEFTQGVSLKDELARYFAAKRAQSRFHYESPFFASVEEEEL